MKAILFYKHGGPEVLEYGDFPTPAPQAGEVLVRHMQLDLPVSTRVQEIMTPVAFLTEEDAPIREVARFMLRRHVHRIIITHNGKLAGIITSMDLLRALLNQRTPSHPTRRRTLHVTAR